MQSIDIPNTGAGPALLPQFLPPAIHSGAAIASATVAAAADKAAKPATTRKCAICGAVGHRADNQAFPACWAANKKNVAAKKSCARRRQEGCKHPAVTPF